ncbi:MAG: peptidase S41 [Alphaproteobacteria bacterium CG1_02_46_17]|nr:MAG: peptidase S41 [Alphaproteobacteria bacterium CG1_02_46_17]
MSSFRLSLLLAVSLFALPNCSIAQDVSADQDKTKQVDQQTNEETYRQLSLFGEAFEKVREKYVEPISDEKLVEFAIKGMLVNLDPHSDYLTSKDFDDMKVQTKGEFGGLGIEVTMEEGIIKVISPIDDTPAFKAGVQAGDYITHLDKKPIIGMTLADAVEQMRGKVGTSIAITIRREGVQEAIELSIVRDVIKIQPVKFRVEDDTIGYIRINQFNRNTYDGVKNAIDKVNAQVGDKLSGYVLDLRNNPGGLLDQAIAVSDAFLDQGEIVSTRGRKETDIKRDNALPGDLSSGLPIVVLINGGSASASEIVAGALQDHHRAILMGTRSFGKGSVQTVVPVSGDGALRLTTARYFTPSGRSIQGKGIDPDIVVDQAKIEKLAEMGIHEEDLKGALSNPTAVKASNDNKKDGPTKDAEKDSDKDYQLARALDLLHGLSLMKNTGR